MASLNEVHLIGHLGKDPEVRTTAGGTTMATLSLATTERWKDKSGERQEKTEWHRIVVFNEHLVGIIQQYLSKGSLIYIQGKLTTRKWQDKDGGDHYSAEVVLSGFDGKLVMLGGGANRGTEPVDEYDVAGNKKVAKKSAGKTKPERTLSEDLEDEIPF